MLLKSVLDLESTEQAVTGSLPSEEFVEQAMFCTEGALLREQITIGSGLCILGMLPPHSPKMATRVHVGKLSSSRKKTVGSPSVGLMSTNTVVMTDGVASALSGVAKG